MRTYYPGMHIYTQTATLIFQTIVFREPNSPGSVGQRMTRNDQITIQFPRFIVILLLQWSDHGSIEFSEDPVQTKQTNESQKRLFYYLDLSFIHALRTFTDCWGNMKSRTNVSSVCAKVVNNKTNLYRD